MREVDWRTVRELMALRARLAELMEAAMLPETAAVAVPERTVDLPVDIWEDETEVVVEAELPGARAADVSVRLEGDALVLGGELPYQEEENGSFVRLERYRGPFRRVIPLPAAVTGWSAATMRSGVLEIRLPKQQPARRRIVVEREGP